MEGHNKQLQEVVNEVVSEKLKFEDEIEALDNRVKWLKELA
ncbi:MAG: hypothetical protein WED07_00590 [Candidatus Freyarchaeum deiterrae]